MAYAPLLTPRDLDVLQALDYCPLTARQLLTVSVTFAVPFTTERKVRGRLYLLAASGRVRRWQYAAAGRGAPNYYTLTRLGFRLLHGPEAALPAKRSFGPVGVARQYHTHALADFLVHALIAAHHEGLSLTEFWRENGVRVTVGSDSIYPDCTFQLRTPEGAELRFFVELDNRGERVRSPHDVESWERKIRLYEAYQDACRRRFRVLVVTTRGGERLRHILATAADNARNKARSLFYGIGLDGFRREANPLHAPCFRDHQGRPAALVPRRRTPAADDASKSPPHSAAFCYAGDPARAPLPPA